MAGTHAVWEEDADEAVLGLPGRRLRQRGGRWHHRIEKRQRERDARSLEERATRDVLLHDHRHG